MQRENEVQHVFLVGAKSLGAYGGYETFVYKLTEYHQNKKNIKYHVACKANGDGCMDETKVDGVTRINDHEFEFHNAYCFKIDIPQIGPAQAIYYDVAALKACCKYIKEHQIKHLVNGGKSCMAGFVLKNTLSDNGGVTRGICKMDEDNNLTEVVETKNIVKNADGAEADGVVVDVNSLVSMNMWGLTPEFLDVLEEGFKEFFKKEVPGNPLKAEYLIPIFIGELLEQGKLSVKVLKTNDTWYGMTYHEDVAAVKDSFKKMLENGVYKADLFADL